MTNISISVFSEVSMIVSISSCIRRMAHIHRSTRRKSSQSRAPIALETIFENLLLRVGEGGKEGPRLSMFMVEQAAMFGLLGMARDE